MAYHPKAQERYRKKSLQRNKRFAHRVSLRFGCQKCGYKKCGQALHFHHRDPGTKKFAVSMNNGYTISKVKEEMRKCDILCGNCHAEEHHQSLELLKPRKGESNKRWRYSYIKRKQFINRVVLRYGCQQCGYKECPAALHFHHIDPNTKEFSIRSKTTSPVWQLKKEMRKCTILCVNCHSEINCTSEVCKHESL